MGQLFSNYSVSPNDIVIVVIGPAGAGKSEFINTVAGQTSLEVGHGLAPCTTKVKHVRCTIQFGGSEKQVVLVDTPAFPADGTLTELDIEEKIRKWSKKTGKGINFAGILYLYKITDIRMTEPPHLLFERLCGNGFHGRVLLVTTMWEKLRKQEDGERRKAELEGHWRRTTDKQVVRRYCRSKESALDMVKALVG